MRALFLFALALLLPTACRGKKEPPHSGSHLARMPDAGLPAPPPPRQVDRPRPTAAELAEHKKHVAHARKLLEDRRPAEAVRAFDAAIHAVPDGRVHAELAAAAQAAADGPRAIRAHLDTLATTVDPELVAAALASLAKLGARTPRPRPGCAQPAVSIEETCACLVKLRGGTTCAPDSARLPDGFLIVDLEDQDLRATSKILLAQAPTGWFFVADLATLWGTQMRTALRRAAVKRIGGRVTLWLETEVVLAAATETSVDRTVTVCLVGDGPLLTSCPLTSVILHERTVDDERRERWVLHLDIDDDGVATTTVIAGAVPAAPPRKLW